MTEIQINPKRKVSLGVIIKALLGGLSSFKVIEDLNITKLYGILDKWIVAYNNLIEPIGKFLFGWLKFRWIEVSPFEYHILVIAIILISAYARAELKYQKQHFPNQSAEPAFLVFSVSLVYLLMIFLPIALLPSYWGWIGGVLAILILLFAYMVLPAGDERSYVGRNEIVKQLKWVLLVTVILMALNYTLFRYIG